ADDRLRVAPPLLKFGFTFGALLWNEAQRSQADKSTGNKHIDLARQLKADLERNRDGVKLLRANFNVIAASTAAMILATPEPMSIVILSSAAYGAKKTGEELGRMVLERSQEQFLGALSTALKSANYTPAALNGMSRDQLIEVIDNARIQDQAFRDILKDEPEALEMLRKHALDRVDNQSAAALLGIAEVKGDVGQIKTLLGNTARQVKTLQKVTGERLDRLTEQMKDVRSLVEESNNAIKTIRQDVADSKRATQTLAQISFLGWSTEQKLEAVKSG